jgi:hypothetical protein
MNNQEKKPSNPRMHNPDGMYASEARSEDCVTLRDIFANSAMQSILSAGITVKTEADVLEAYDYAAKNSYLIADAMLKQREL